MKRSFQLILIASVAVLLVVLVASLGLFSPEDEGDKQLRVSTRDPDVSAPPQNEPQPDAQDPSGSAVPLVPPAADSPVVKTSDQATSPAPRVTPRLAPSKSSAPEVVTRDSPAGDSPGHSGAQSEANLPQKPSFPGIKQDYGDIMLSGLRHIPGETDDAFVITFTRMAGSSAFDGSVWMIGEYRQRGTTALMDMPSHSSLRLASDGNPQSPEAGARLLIGAVPGEKASKKLTVNRPGFEGEELVGVRVGIYNRSSRTLQMARVSAGKLAAKKSVKRAKVEAP